MKKTCQINIIILLIALLSGCAGGQKSSQLASLKQQSDLFLMENAQQENVIVTSSGLQYQVLKPAQGPRPNKRSSVTVHYEGKLVTGKVIDSTLIDNKPVSFRLNEVIAGWREGILLMTEGSYYRIWIPYYLAYGEDSGQGIPPYANLVFDIELVKVE